MSIMSLSSKKSQSCSRSHTVHSGSHPPTWASPGATSASHPQPNKGPTSISDLTINIITSMSLQLLLTHFISLLLLCRFSSTTTTIKLQLAKQSALKLAEVYAFELIVEDSIYFSSIITYTITTYLLPSRVYLLYKLLIAIDIYQDQSKFNITDIEIGMPIYRIVVEI